MLRLSGEVRLGRALLCLGALENSENLGSGSARPKVSSHRRGPLRLGVGVLSRNRNGQFWPFSLELFQPKHTI